MNDPRIRRGQRGYRQFEKANKPPPDMPFCWLTREMLESEAWRAMTLPARRALDRLMIEHMSHAGTMNGELPCTYDDFQRFGVSRKSINAAIRVVEALGWVDVVFRGHLNHGVADRPSLYGLTWLPRADNTPPSNRWKSIKDRASAKLKVKIALEGRKPSKRTNVVLLRPDDAAMSAVSRATASPAVLRSKPTPRQDI
jgi:hypothetical protein